MKTTEIITIGKNGITQWMVTDSAKCVIDFMQYLTDSVNDINRFLVYDPEKDQAVKLTDMLKLFGIRKRTFKEKTKRCYYI